MNAIKRALENLNEIKQIFLSVLSPNEGKKLFLRVLYSVILVAIWCTGMLCYADIQQIGE